MVVMKQSRYSLIAGILFVDQIVKYIVRTYMELGQSIPVVNNIFHLTYVQNTGAAFNLFEGKYNLLTLVPLVALTFGVWYMERHRDEHGLLLWSLIMIIAGGIGNLIDRIALGFVTDLFDFRVFPVFNVADISICVGCGLLLLYVLFFDKKKLVEAESEEIAEVDMELSKQEEEGYDEQQGD